MSMRTLTPDLSKRGWDRFGEIMRVLGGLIALGVALEAIYVAWFGVWDVSIHRSVSLVFCTAVAVFAAPLAKRHSRGIPALKAILWIVDFGLIAIMAYAVNRFLVKLSDMESLIASYSGAEQFGALAALLVLIELARRHFGLPLAAVAGVAILYCLYGAHLPWIFQHSGFSLEQMVEVVWYGFQGVFGLPTGIVLSLIMIFIVFGAVLQGSGAGDSLVKIAFSLAGGSRGGPAHAAIVASAMFGTMSGSVAANVVGTGTFTIPLIKKRGFTGAFAGAVEASASSGGQIMPPVMGTAVFLMAELVGMPYLTICVAALLPALFYYASLFVAVGLEARRLNIEPIPLEEREEITRHDLINAIMFVGPILAIIATLVIGRSPAMAGLMATLSALVLAFINPEIRRQPQRLLAALAEGGIAGSRILMAVGAIGVILAILDLTGLSLNFATSISQIGAGNLFLALCVSALACIALGMGMPTLPAYLIIVLILGPAIKTLGVPSLALHMFVFYFGVFASITPPVALAAFAAAPIANANPIVTAARAVGLSIIGFVIPFVFVYDHSLLLVLDFSWSEFTWTCFRLGLALWLLATAVTGFETKPISTPERLLRFAIAAAVVSQIPVAQWGGVALGIAFIGFGILSKRSATAQTNKPS